MSEAMDRVVGDLGVATAARDRAKALARNRTERLLASSGLSSWSIWPHVVWTVENGWEGWDTLTPRNLATLESEILQRIASQTAEATQEADDWEGVARGW